ncbi:antibiotic biosynthesis monooxygenase [Micromonospora sp. HM5-17]|uniref:antibiotic biosynthesis monooxygenase n=1 Tax=Micromonospora sp. HM5-17 TaxID=2487710 RepID=UPI000F482D24|nr:antibiotic biosynthesis monooxygenase [Micromonospora sp. HM5-17]ROT32978.1 antibiotic biosynthesis monooxygenase [Micromonospora sp. HM5-17]
MTTETGFYSIIDYPAGDPTTQEKIVATFAEIQERWVRHHPGYRSARFLASTDGERVCAIVHWAREADLRAFEESPDIDRLYADIDRALRALPGVGTPRMTRYRLLREVRPEPTERSGS